MEQKKGIDIINEVLEACILAYPVSSFIISLYKQYISRGWLTKKQLEGLYRKAQKIQDLPPGKLASLEAIINKMPACLNGLSLYIMEVCSMFYSVIEIANLCSTG